MFNSYNSDNTQEVKISAVSGTICKTHKKSFIIRFGMGSTFASRILAYPPEMEFGESWNRKTEEIVVLQVMNSNDGYVVCEIIKKSDYEADHEE